MAKLKSSISFEIHKDDAQEIFERVKSNAVSIEEIVDSLTKEFCEDLDELMVYWKDIITDRKNPPTDEELAEIVMELPILLYFAGNGIEKLGIEEDISSAIRNKIYNEAHLNAEGTVSVKESEAELASQKQFIIQCAYKRAYKIMKFKIDTAFELLNSAKKVIGSRVVMTELAKTDPDYNTKSSKFRNRRR